MMFDWVVGGDRFLGERWGRWTVCLGGVRVGGVEGVVLV